MIDITNQIAIDPDEIEETFVRAAGPGGQNVNKVSSAVQMRFDIRHSPSLPDYVKAKAEKLAGSRLTKDGVIVIQAMRYRTQEQNRADALERLVELLQKAAVRQAYRVKTKPSKAAKKRRLESKTKRGVVKKLRSGKVGLD
ncbi:alternative ribosome rescue aminoacyl-tRNA hydrolase ArfB [Breoghania sp. L-A4]|uniref:alternative ribosome rescue aminoacyl-tRNA hydrolase ArfB n=1 Tax=Breoghania sp. L-A4 TaxID=2304600 RepID=UPI000E35CC06|nr:alternative ribosome rescue aminoacyl-tRNA hydrolase ArfB [Breoghania sp. L-A4]AXS40129.1 aminoacyl-tRNA hydrolase [Breoghania sp. L-A4]